MATYTTAKVEAGQRRRNNTIAERPVVVFTGTVAGVKYMHITTQVDYGKMEVSAAIARAKRELALQKSIAVITTASDFNMRVHGWHETAELAQAAKREMFDLQKASGMVMLGRR